MANNIYSTYRNGLYLDDPQYLKVGIFGDLIHDEQFIDEITPYCEEVFLINSLDAIGDAVKSENLQLFFGILGDESQNISKLRAFKNKNQYLTIGLGIPSEYTHSLSEYLSLECERYFVAQNESASLFWEFQKTREIALERSISRYESKMLEAILDAYSVSVADEFGTIFYINKMFAKETGYLPFELIGANHRVFKHPGNPYSIYKELWETISQNRVWRGQIINMTKDGEMIHSDTTIIPYHDERKKSTLYLALRQNIPLK